MSSSRTGTTTASIHPGCEAATMKALCGQPARQAVHWVGSGNCSTRSAVGRYRASTSASAATTSARSITLGRRPAGKESMRATIATIDEPLGDTADAVEQLVLGGRQRREERRQPDGDEQPAEAGVHPLAPDVQAHRDRDAHAHPQVEGERHVVRDAAREPRGDGGARQRQAERRESEEARRVERLGVQPGVCGRARHADGRRGTGRSPTFGRCSHTAPRRGDGLGRAFTPIG